MISTLSPKAFLLKHCSMVAERFEALGFSISNEFGRFVNSSQGDRANVLLSYRVGGEDVQIMRETTIYTGYIEMDQLFAQRYKVVHGNHANIYRETHPTNEESQLDRKLMNIIRQYTPLKTAIHSCELSSVLCAKEYEERKLLEGILEFHMVPPTAFAELHALCVKDLFDIYNSIFVPREVL